MPPPVAGFVGAITRLNHLLFKGASLLLLLMVPLMLFAVTARYLFNHPADWALELATLLFGPFFLLGGPYLLHTGGHVNLDLARRAVPPWANRLFDLINYPMVAVFAGILLYYAWPFALSSWEMGETSFSSWNPPVWPVKFVIPAALVLLGLQAVAEWLRVLCGEQAGAGTGAGSAHDAEEVL